MKKRIVIILINLFILCFPMTVWGATVNVNDGGGGSSSSTKCVNGYKQSGNICQKTLESVGHLTINTSTINGMVTKSDTCEKYNDSEKEAVNKVSTEQISKVSCSWINNTGKYTRIVGINTFADVYENTDCECNYVIALSSSGGTDFTPSKTQDCTSLLGSPTDNYTPAFYLSKAFQIIKYIGIVILSVMSLMDFLTAISSNDKDALNKAARKTMIRFILCVVLFLLPTLINFILTYLNDRATDLCGIE